MSVLYRYKNVLVVQYIELVVQYTYRSPVSHPGDHALVDVFEVKVKGGQVTINLGMARLIYKQ